MNIYKIALIAICTVGLTSCDDKKKQNTPMSDPTHTPNIESVIENNTDSTDMANTSQIKVVLEAKSDSKVSGTIIFTEVDDTVNMLGELEGLKPNTEHAIHLHETADCSSHDAKSTGGHWNPTDSKHGKWGDSEGYHRGDIGNFTSDENGNATVTFKTDEWCLDCEDSTRTISGRGLIIHQGKDDFKTQPTGNAGKRIACGGLEIEK
ncbi:superoxide dismutase copper/zinc binding protein [Formosa agariphila KMM 3901]|uniref:Superoxide dismutase copper/zinc binding protein n=1 Tax=Formosa agariphila (strain DSM 15362 / KCTC 12365 / LMG 23005 / KMM 3901 / M-2Alg 35-1) TaxID=1347342 RepID=T2KS30_FORAG|nr:superoxide dismutase family protein [Formosa agariphila]CDF80914.1 superoxide dismutase copper/zinc binding protein [Formosa agariphila KMM 3901]